MNIVNWCSYVTLIVAVRFFLRHCVLTDRNAVAYALRGSDSPQLISYQLISEFWLVDAVISEIISEIEKNAVAQKTLKVTQGRQQW